MTDAMSVMTGDVDVRYKKSSQFRVVYAEGCFGGVSARGVVRSSFYSERAALPTSSVLQIKDGFPVAEHVKEGGVGLVREVEIEVVMDLNAAVAYYNWLGDKISTLRESLGIDDENWRAMIKTVVK